MYLLILDAEYVVEASRGIVLGCGGKAAILLLPSLIEAVRRITGIIVIADVWPEQGEGTIQTASAWDACVKYARGKPGGAGRQQT